MTDRSTPRPAANPDVGGIVHLEHVNFETPDQEMAVAFFIAGLGLTRDPYARVDETNMGINVGLQQFHLPRRGERTPPFAGIVGLVVPDLPGVRRRLAALDRLGRFDGTPYAYEEGDGTALVTSPFGYRLRLHPAGSLPFLRPLGLAYVEVPVPPGSASRIAAFYRTVLRAVAETAAVDGARAALVTMGPHQTVRFVERALDDYATHSMHIAYYITHFNEAREALRKAGALADSGTGDPFFFDKIHDPETGDVLFTIYNEVRSVYHRDFMRPLVNRWPLVAEPFEDQSQSLRAVTAALEGAARRV